MANKKLTLEVDAETSKAQQKINQLNVSGGASVASPVDSAAERTARSLDRASKSVDNFGAQSSANAGAMKAAARAFTGMAVGMAASYAARQMDAGPAKTALGYAGSIAQGAAAMSMLGPKGMAIGAAAGAVKQYIDNNGAEEAEAKAKQEEAQARMESLATLKEQIAHTREWKATLDSLTDTETDLQQRQVELRAEIQKREEEEKKLKGALSGEAGLGGDPKKFAELSTRLRQVAAETDALRVIGKNLANEAEKTGGGSSALDYGGVDALARVGGAFSGSDSGFRSLQQVNEKQVAILEKIERKAGTGKGVF